MKTANLVMMVCVMFSSMSFATEQQPDVVEKMGLKKTAVEGATIYYEPCFEQKLGVVKKAYQDYRAKISVATKPELISIEELADKKKVILSDIYMIVGIDDEELKEKLVEIADSFIKTGNDFTMPLAGGDNTIYLMLQTTTKEYLRSGGTLPNVTYDKETDTVKSGFFFGSEQDNASNQELLLPMASLDEVEKVLDVFFTRLPQEMDTLLGENSWVIIHEVSEFAILLRLKSKDPYLRWFSDGFANAITYEVMKRHFSQEDADAFLKDFSTASYQDIKSQCNLLYWFSMNYSMRNQSPIDQEDDLTHARYAFATEQARRIIEAYGIDCIKKIIDQYLETDNKHPGQLLPAINKATGDDIEKHLMEYQSFRTKEEGMDFYRKEMDATVAAKNYAGAVFTLMRILELRGEQPYDKESLDLRMSIAKMLHYDGHEQKATQWITEFADMMCQSKKSHNRYVGRMFVIMYAIQIEQPKVALEYAQAILLTDPDDAHALMIVMVNEAEQKNTKKAVELAKKICEIEPDDKHPCHAVAKDVLEKLDK